MRIRVIFISKKIIILAMVFALITVLMKMSASSAEHRWKEKMYSPGLAGKTVVIDPGHGGADPGAVHGKVKEADINMALARALQKKLEANHVIVKMTRQDDKGLVPEKAMSYLDRWGILQERKMFALDQRGHLLISIHADSNPDPKTSGATVYYYDNISRLLAECIQNKMNELGARKHTVQQGNFTVLKDNEMPSILIEAGFITNRHDLDNLRSRPDYIASLIYSGLEEYAESSRPNNTP